MSGRYGTVLTAASSLGPSREQQPEREGMYSHDRAHLAVDILSVQVCVQLVSDACRRVTWVLQIPVMVPEPAEPVHTGPRYI